jgi:tetrahedral aminopeptidase
LKKGDDIMSNLNIRQTLKDLMSDWGVSGYEHGVAKRAVEAFSHFTDDIRIDKLGNVIATVHGAGPEPRPRVMLAAHLDEIGLMVTKVERNGFLRITNIGGVDARTQMAQEVVVHGRDGEYIGIVGSKPPHLTSPEERGKAAPLSGLFIDLGMPEEMVRQKVRVGDPVTIRRSPLELKYDRISGKSLDNKASVAAVLECLAELNQLKVNVDVIAVGTVQEERGKIGAGPAAFGIHPDVAIAIDVTFGDMPGAPDDANFALDGGPTIGVGPNLHRKVQAGLEAAAEQLSIPWVHEFLQEDTGTDAWAIQIQHAGIPTGLVSIPLRYMHTSVETVCYRDIERSGKLMAHYIAGIDWAYVEGLSCYLKD